MLCLPGSLLGKGAGGPALDLNLLSATLDSRMSFTRLSTATDLLSSSTTGTYNTIGVNQPRISVAAGLLIESPRTQSLGVTDSPATQTITLATGTYSSWMIGTGSVTSSAGTALGSGFGAATQGVPNTITITTGGTVLFTTAGTVLRMECELGGFADSYIPNGGAVGTTAARAGETATVPATAFGVSPVAGTLVVEWDTAWPSGAGGQGIVSLSDGVNSLIHLDINGSTSRFIILDNAGVSRLNILGPAYAANTVIKTAITWQVGDARIVTNGVLGNTGAPTVIPTLLPTLYLGKHGLFANFLDGHIRRVRYYNRRLADATLQALTT